MLKANHKVKSKLIQTLMGKANEQLDKLKDSNTRTSVIGSTVKAILPILREHVKLLDNYLEENKSCGNVGKK